MNICLLMMGGSGIRFGASCPKQFVEIKNEPVFCHILRSLCKSESIDKIIVVTHKDWIDFASNWIRRIDSKKVYGVIPGGLTRSESVKNGLMKASEIAKSSDVVLIHDATHPYVDHTSMKDLISAVQQYGAATMVQRQYDTCYTINDEDMITTVTPRQYVVSGASPEGFRFGDIFDIYANAEKEELDSMTSAGAIALAHGLNMKVCTLNTLNLKITYQKDMEILKNATDFFLK